MAALPFGWATIEELRDTSLFRRTSGRTVSYLLSSRLVLVLFLSACGAFVGAAMIRLPGQTPPPPPLRPAIEHMADVKRKLAQVKPVDFTAKRAVDYSRNFLAAAERAYRSNRAFEADRYAEAADAMLHVADHQEHLYAGGGPKGPPPAEAIADHLDRAYFRTQQADYFAEQSKIPQAGALAKWARDFYQLAVRAYERKDLVAADENTKCAEEVTRALENLAQANTPAKLPAPPVPPRRPEWP